MTMIKLETFLLIKSNVHSAAEEILLKHLSTTIQRDRHKLISDHETFLRRKISGN